MKITKKNNEDKLDLIINKITSIETRIDKIESCSTIANELYALN